MLFEKVNDFAFAIVTEATRAVNIARGMVEDAQRAARAEVRAKEYTLCRFCQAALTNFLIANPDADHEATQAETQTLWEDCRSCSEEYNAHLDAQAKEWENRSYGESYAEELNANPHRFHETESGYRKEKSEKEDWRAWREDYRSSRPPVTCQKCDTHYPRGKDEGNAIYRGFTLVQCGNCPKPPTAENIQSVMRSMQTPPCGYLIVDEILFVATTQFHITATHTTILEALRQLWNNGQVKHRKNPFGQDCFALL
ncbi:MAG: hypothetical protein OXU27_03190 [Candidatus Poribacteria bacterium]|nr:hypothetical protein [Candidatus Poribacteria bacterium]